MAVIAFSADSGISESGAVILPPGAEGFTDAVRTLTALRKSAILEELARRYSAR